MNLRYFFFVTSNSDEDSIHADEEKSFRDVNIMCKLHVNYEDFWVMSSLTNFKLCEDA